MTTSALPPTVVLRRGAGMPRLGLGTASMDAAAAERAVASGIEAGYRLIDTAENYANEVGVGRGLSAGSGRCDQCLSIPFAAIYITKIRSRREPSRARTIEGRVPARSSRV